MLTKLIKKIKPERLPSFEEVIDITRSKNRIYLGVKAIKVDQIIGSEGRYRDFDKDFLPVNENLRHRLRAISHLYHQGFHFPPISVFKIDDYYFVRDGNHRVAIAKSRKQIYIDAEVTEYILDVPITKNLNLKERLLIQEHSDFLDITGLTKLGRDAVINLSNPKYYTKLIEIIKNFIEIENKKLTADLSFSEGANLWYHKVFLPFAEDAYRFDLLHRFVNRTTGDLYVWLQTNWHKIKDFPGQAHQRLSYMDLGNTEDPDLKPSISKREIKILREIYTKNSSREDNFLFSHHIAIAVINVLIYIEQQKNPQLVIVKRKYHPSEGQWSLPISMLRVDEEIKEAASRCQQKVLGIKMPIDSIQFCIKDQKDRYPFGRSIAIGTVGLIFDPKHKLEFTAGHLADSVKLSALLEVPDLVFDHSNIYSQALCFIAENASHADIFLNSLPNNIPFKTVIDSLNYIKKCYYDNFDCHT